MELDAHLLDTIGLCTCFWGLLHLVMVCSGVRMREAVGDMVVDERKAVKDYI